MPIAPVELNSQIPDEEFTMQTNRSRVLMVSVMCVFGVFSYSEDSIDWDAKYRTLLEKRPDIRKKVEGGGATKEDIIAWMKKGGDKMEKKQRRYYGWKPEAKDPTKFRPSQPELFSGPQPGEKLAPFQVTPIHPQADEDRDPITSAAGKPLLLILQDHSGSGMKGLYLLSPVLETIAKRSKSGLKSSVVFLSDDPNELDPKEVINLSKQARVYEMSHSKDGRDGPGKLGLDRNVKMTILIADSDGVVKHNFPFLQPMLYPDPHVVGALAEIIGEDRETLVGWLEEYEK
ncbi:MAG: hypothetical protein AAFX06_10790 [Planctomycetota bacterium]